MDIAFLKRRLLFVGLLIVADLLLMALLASAAQARQAHLAQTRAISSVPTGAYNSPNIVTDALSALVDTVGQTVGVVHQKVADDAGYIILNLTHSSGFIARTARVSARFAIRAVGGGFVLVFRTVGDSLLFIGRMAICVYTIEERFVGGALRLTSHVAHLHAVIQPKDATPVPIITQLREQQAALIQSGTLSVALPFLANGEGGACDIGKGNGDYPMSWCSAPMDTIATVPYTAEPINRECTSYAYWYFASVEGHADFHAMGNAKYWAVTSNYPTHTTPAVGAIAVETVGAYGHVAIVQALAGQTYAGEKVPTGYVLVSEMNYDWGGHFRYSFAPPGKFSAFIYP